MTPSPADNRPPLSEPWTAFNLNDRWYVVRHWRQGGQLLRDFLKSGKTPKVFLSEGEAQETADGLNRRGNAP